MADRGLYAGRMVDFSDTADNSAHADDGGDATTAATRGLAELVAQAQRIVVFSGAGISTESGIPDFRSPGGVWTRYDPREMTFDRYVDDPQVRAAAWRMRTEMRSSTPEPNAAHRAVADLEHTGRGLGVITQNIDGLHTRAGSQHVIEVHGTMLEVMCIGHRPQHGTPSGCGYRVDAEQVHARLDAGEVDPACPDCGGLLKSATISFGQVLDADVIDRAEQLAARADLMIAVGSSLQVHPAAGLPLETLTHGGRLAIVNDEPTPLDDLAHVVVRGRAARVLPAAFHDVLS